jgi:hypothetical protein
MLITKIKAEKVIQALRVFASPTTKDPHFLVVYCGSMQISRTNQTIFANCIFNR